MLKTVIFFLLVLNLGINSLDIASNVEDITKSEKTNEQNDQTSNNNPPRVIESFKTEPDFLDIEVKEQKFQEANKAPDDIRSPNYKPNSLDTESNVEDATKSERAAEEENVQQESNSHGDIESLNNEPTSNVNSESPQTETKKAASGLKLTEDQINQLADKILKAHGVKPDDESLQNYKSVERLKKVVQHIETNIENKLKETVAQAMTDNLEASNKIEEIDNENEKTEPPKDEEILEDVGYYVIYKDPGLEAEEMDIQNQEVVEVQNDNAKVLLEEDVEDDLVEENAAKEQEHILQQQQGTEYIVKPVQQDIEQETQNIDDRVEAIDIKENDLKEKGTVANKETETKGEIETTPDFESTNQKPENEERNEAEDLVEKNVEEEVAKRYEEQKEKTGDSDDSEERDIKITGVPVDEVKLTENMYPTEKDDVSKYEKLSESIKEDMQVLQEDSNDTPARDKKIPDVTTDKEIKNNEEIQDVTSANQEAETDTYLEDGNENENAVVKDEAEKAEAEEYVKQNEIIKENDETEINEEDKENLENVSLTNQENDIDTDSKDESKLEDTEIEKDDKDKYEEQKKTAKDDDEAEIDEEDEDEEYEEIQENKLEDILETCRLEEGNCEQDEKERLYEEESNINTNFDEQSETNSETTSESGYLERIVKFLFDRF